MENILADHGFEPEIAGGGVYILSRYFDNGAWIWATDQGGLGLPEHGDWLICTYPADYMEPTGENLAFEAYSEDYGAASIHEGAQAAIEAAEALPDKDATCRNGKPWAECRCC